MKTKNKVKTYTMLVMLVTLLSCNLSAEENKTPTITKTFDLDQPGNLNAKSAGGKVVVTGHDQNKVEVQVFISKNGKLLSESDPMVEEILKDYELNINKEGSTINAKVKRISNFKVMNNIGISLSIFVPQEMSCNVGSSGGSLKISGVTGSHNFSSSGGGLKLENIKGKVDAGSSGGGVHAKNLTGDIDLSSSGGGISVDGVTGKIIAHSSGGSVRLDNIVGEVEASSSGGGVSISGECAYVKATSSGGSVRVNISNLSKELYVKSSGGGVDVSIKNGDELGLDLDLSSSKVNIDLHNFTGKSEKDRVEGAMNGGGIPFYVRSSGGNVNVRFE